MGPVVCQDMVESNADVWKRATDHPFLQQCKDATIPRQSFNWWLVQDYGFVLKFVDLAKAIISKAPAQDQQSLQGSLAVLDDELVFYQASYVSIALGLVLYHCKSSYSCMVIRCICGLLGLDSVLFHRARSRCILCIFKAKTVPANK